MIAERSLQRKGFQPFNPKIYTQHIIRGRRAWIERCYLPGYIFVRFDIDADDRWPQINSCRGVKALLYSSSERPAPIRERAMQVILERCNGDRVVAEDIDNALRRVLPVGSAVRINEAPFEDFIGKVTWSAEDRVRVVLSLFGRQTKVSIASKSVELI